MRGIIYVFTIMRLLITAKIFLLCILVLLVIPVYSQAATYPVTWNPRSIEQTIGLGGTKDLTVTFKSSSKLKNVDLWVVPKLQPFVSIAPNHFTAINSLPCRRKAVRHGHFESGN